METVEDVIRFLPSRHKKDRYGLAINIILNFLVTFRGMQPLDGKQVVETVVETEIE
ncbi:MAG: hypothetical protein RML10_08960 [Geminocystis sp.]|nr:hypothetical protein [Geminocystis sp.]MCX8078234.1 hypothetical protein [Geminocystis sp.]MDW8463696.1 hypothetical protein [Geminocystis sp.]HIK37158.1 hypothetical protein [Geminocystis sp. M7585_C2015_104]